MKYFEALTLDFEDYTPKDVPQQSWVHGPLNVAVEQLADDISCIAGLQ